MTRINGYRELLDEKQRLLWTLSFRRAEIRDEIKTFRENLKVLNRVISFFQRFTDDGSQSLMKLSAQIGVDLLARKTLRHSGWFPRLIVPLLLRSVAGSLFNGVRKKFSKKA